jgi:phosphoribosylaminoimidazolecarboxamide formyltransferase/IMP cyclohydrolase
VKLLIAAGVRIFVQPGGSIRDQEVINAVNKVKAKMLFTNTRHFNH